MKAIDTLNPKRYVGAGWIVLISWAAGRARLGQRAHVASAEAGEEGQTLCGIRIGGNRDRSEQSTCVRCDLRADRLDAKRSP